MSDFTASIKALLDISGISNQIKDIERNQVVLRNISIDTSKLESELQNALNSSNIRLNIGTIDTSNMVRQMQQAGENAGKTLSGAIRSSINPDMLNPAASALDKLRSRLSGKGMDTDAINRIISGITSSAKDANIQITKISESFQTAGQNAGQLKNFKIQGIDQMGNAVSMFDTFNSKTGELQNSMTTVTRSFAGTSDAAEKMAEKTRKSLESILNTNLTNGKFAADLETLKTKVSSLSSVTTPLANNLNELDAAFETMRNPDKSMDDRINAMRTYQELIPGVRAQISQLSAEESKAASEAKAVKDALSLQNNRDSFFRTVQKEISALTPETEKFKDRLEDLKSQIATADATQLSHLKNEFNEVVDAIKEEEQAAKKAKQELATLSKSTTLSNNIQAWMNNNAKAAEKFGTELKDLQDQLNNNKDPEVLQKVNARFREIQSEAKAAGLTTDRFTTSLKNVALQVAGLTSAVAVFQKISQAVKEGCQTVIELDEALVDLQKTTTASSKQLQDFYFDANEIAKEYGATTKDIIQSAADWSRLGYNLEDSKLMSQYSSMFKSISPGMDIDTATTSLVSVMKAKRMPLRIEMCA